MVGEKGIPASIERAAEFEKSAGEHNPPREESWLLGKKIQPKDALPDVNRTVKQTRVPPRDIRTRGLPISSEVRKCERRRGRKGSGEKDSTRSSYLTNRKKREPRVGTTIG